MKHTIYLPKELEEELEPFRPYINLSKVLQDGLRKEIELQRLNAKWNQKIYGEK